MLQNLNIGESLNKLGEVLSLGFGDAVAVGMIFGMISDTQPVELYNAIINKQDLTVTVTEDNWADIRRMADRINLDEINTQRILNELRKKRLDLLSVIINTPGGLQWVDSQLATVKKKLSG